MKNKIFLLSVIALLFIACEEDNLVEDNILAAPIINIGQTSSDTLGIAITASNSEAANQTTDVLFTNDTILVSYTVTAYGEGEAFITLSNTAMASKTFELNGNKSIGQEPLSFKPTSVNVDVKSGYTGVVAMAVIGK